ncbi:MAG: glycoside hydrolase family 97 catalytic domain-containing protein [Bacteroidia bacterium]|nr:glycoside hydrolase family 97 catalytic domain-containing protein [Bacteroidia bacterium]
MKRIIVCAAIAAMAMLAASCGGKRICKVYSPDGKARIEVIACEEGLPTFSVTVDGVCVIKDSKMGYSSSEGDVPGTDWKAGKAVKSSFAGEWRPVWGKREVVPDVYNQASVTFKKGDAAVKLEVRAYDDGVAFRFVNEAGDAVWNEATEFNFAGDYTAWFYNGERHNIGPELLSESDGERLPVMTVKVSDDLYLAVHEAYLLEGKPLIFNASAGSTLFEVTSEDTEVGAGWQSAWRLVMYGRQPGDLVDSHVIELLNPDPEEGMDFSWVKPGVNLWDWRIDGAIWEDYHYGMNYDSWTRMIDFAQENGFSALVLDANWYGPEFSKDSDPIKGDKASDVQNIIKYGAERGVGVWLYLNDVAGRQYPIEETLAQYEQWGAAGVKYGFMFGEPTKKNEQTRMITELCAKHHLAVDFHDYPVHPWGQSRTWPNAITREFCKAQLDGHSIFYPITFVTTVFVDMVAGPVDMNNGMFDLRQGRTTRKDNNQEVPSTVCAEAARTLITYSGATVIPDIPEYYQKYPELLDFLASEQQPWKESKTLSGEIGEYIVMMRQSRDGKYLIGAATNEDARTLNVSLGFLPKGGYKLSIVEDGPDAHYLTNREVISPSTVEMSIADGSESIELHLAPGGGACVIIEKK